ncbi:transmembrane protein 205 [Neocloeon triangulifer]|uniref:transmembrane protein 205 n=1 Tax=Neocloeon triangulifer TaxID=2078957 RepID=UPI00286F0F72|nr:transmembrane protein 205 [Neocloeon triangulifer]
MCARTMLEKLSEDKVAELTQVPPELTTPAPQLPPPGKRPKRTLDIAKVMASVPRDTNLPPDSIAQMTAYTKKCVDVAYTLAAKAQKSNFYVVLTRTTQPAHAILFSAVLLVASSLAPSHQGTSSKSTSSALLYLACFAAHFGAQLWMTFVSGLSLYFSLPRHNFGAVQRVLFPRYFSLNAVLSMGTLLGFVRQHPSSSWSTVHSIQGVVLSACFLGELAVRLYLTGPLVSLISAKEEIESRAGLGSEVGHQAMGGLVHCPHYIRLHKSFRKVHCTIAIANMACLASSAFHLHFIAQQLAAAVS